MDDFLLQGEEERSYFYHSPTLFSRAVTADNHQLQKSISQNSYVSSILQITLIQLLNSGEHISSHGSQKSHSQFSSRVTVRAHINRNSRYYRPLVHNFENRNYEVLPHQGKAPLKIKHRSAFTHDKQTLVIRINKKQNKRNSPPLQKHFQ